MLTLCSAVNSPPGFVLHFFSSLSVTLFRCSLSNNGLQIVQSLPRSHGEGVCIINSRATHEFWICNTSLRNKFFSCHLPLDSRGDPRWRAHGTHHPHSQPCREARLPLLQLCHSFPFQGPIHPLTGVKECTGVLISENQYSGDFPLPYRCICVSVS